LLRLPVTRATQRKANAPPHRESRLDPGLDDLQELITPTAPADETNRHFITEHLKADLKGRSVRGAAVTLVTQVGRLVLNTGSTVVLARLLTPRDFGLLAMVTAITGFVVLSKDLGLSMATVQKDEIDHNQASALFWVSVAASAVMALLTAAIAPAVASFYHEPRLKAITFALASGLIFGGLATQHQALLRRQMRFRALAAVDLGSFAFGAVVAIVLAVRGAGYWALVLMQLAIAFGGTVGVWLACRWRPGMRLRGTGVRAMLAFGWNLAGYNVISYFARNLDKVLIGWRWSAFQAGLYSKSYQLLLLPIYQINTPVTAVALPALSRLAGSPERYRQAYLRIQEKVTMITMPGIVLMFATSDWLVSLILGPQWTGATRIFMLLSIAAFVQPLAQTVGWLFITQGRTRELLQWGIIGGVLTIGPVIAGLPWGAVGVAAAFSITGLCVRTPLLFWLVGRSGPVRAADLYRQSAPSVCASGFCLLALLAFRRWAGVSSPAVGLGIAVVITAAVAACALWLQPAGRRALLDLRGLFALVTQGAENEHPGYAGKGLREDD
jgi:O-antigen/teichoic acid export membrane protein